MTNAPALIVRHARFTQVITVLLALMLAIAGVGISIELHNAQAAIELILLPLVLVLLAAYLLKTAYDRWAISATCLSVSAEGLTMPGITVRPIPWTAVKSVRGVCCNPVAKHAGTPRQYMLFDVEAPESFGVTRPSAVQRLAAPLPEDAPLVSLDLSELDTGRDAILNAVRRFHPTAVADNGTHPVIDAAASGNDASIRLPSVSEIRLGARRVRADAAALHARRGEIRPAILDQWRRSASFVQSRALALMAMAGEMLRTTVAWARRQALLVQNGATSNAARGLEAVRAAALDIRHRFSI